MGKKFGSALLQPARSVYVSSERFFSKLYVFQVHTLPQADSLKSIVCAEFRLVNLITIIVFSAVESQPPRLQYIALAKKDEHEENFWLYKEK